VTNPLHFTNKWKCQTAFMCELRLPIIDRLSQKAKLIKKENDTTEIAIVFFIGWLPTEITESDRSTN
jgi:hypothetical protein